MSAASSFRDALVGARERADRALDRLLPAATAPPTRLHEAMRYSIFAGGKRIRPALVLLTGEALNVPVEELEVGAAVVEMIHTYSLIHDDLPALDNDDLRRGKPTLHRAFDEATAVLAGDALLTLGLTLLASQPVSVPADRRQRAVALLGAAIGSTGMIGGQVDDLAAENDWPTDNAAAGALLEAIHRRKTGDLIAACLGIAGIYAGVSETVQARLVGLGHALGLMFQIRDDMIDVEGTAGTLGKTAGKDAAVRKLTYPGLYGLTETRRMLERTADEARSVADALPADGEFLGSLIDYLTTRDR
ncbi:MAG: polyprenyl synthetase family protein [Acidobacteriota bacterium]